MMPKEYFPISMPHFPLVEQIATPGKASQETATAEGTRLDSGLTDLNLRRLLERMQTEAVVLRRDATDPACFIMVRSSARGSLSAGRVSRSVVEAGLTAGVLFKTRSGVVEISAGPPEEIRRDAAPPTMDSRQARQVTQVAAFNEAESPLLWLHRRKGADGQPLIDASCFLAGERFRRDVTTASMLPSVTTNWSRMESSTGRASPRDPATASDAAIAARQRVRAAYSALGNDMGNFVLDVCGFLVPLKEAETRRGWPQRSGKIVLRMALARLAEHYGVSSIATGPRSTPARAWHTDPGLMSIQAWLVEQTDA